jgi:hypothetical protein
MDTIHDDTFPGVTNADLPLMEDRMKKDAEKSKSLSRSRHLNLWKRFLIWDWHWECLSWVLAIGALAAMVAVLATAQDKPMTTWRDQHYNISLNAVVAVLTALLKGTSMFAVAEGTLAPRFVAHFWFRGVADMSQ